MNDTLETIAVRIPRGLRAQLEKEAKEEGVSFADLIRDRLQKSATVATTRSGEKIYGGDVEKVVRQVLKQWKK